MMLSVSYSVDIRSAKALHPARTILQASCYRTRAPWFLAFHFIHSHPPAFTRNRITLHRPYQFDRSSSTLWITNSVVTLCHTFFFPPFHRVVPRTKCPLLANAWTSIKYLSRCLCRKPQHFHLRYLIQFVWFDSDWMALWFWLPKRGLFVLQMILIDSIYLFRALDKFHINIRQNIIGNDIFILVLSHVCRCQASKMCAVSG